jgi:hypothetical protein
MYSPTWRKSIMPIKSRHPEMVKRTVTAVVGSDMETPEYPYT